MKKLAFAFGVAATSLATAAEFNISVDGPKAVISVDGGFVCYSGV